MNVARRFRAYAAVALSLALISPARAAEQMDQSNRPEWGGGWTHVNPAADGQAAMWQTFKPTCPNLTAVEIDVLTIDPGRGDDVLTVEIARDGAVLSSTERSVEDGFDGLLRFEFPQGVPLAPEQSYELTVRDTGATRFGWKYGSNTYERGSRYVFAQERPGSDWFFRTYAGMAPTEAQYRGGTGDPNDPYQIATAADLIALGATPEDYGKHFILIADIDLDPNLPGGKVFDRAVIAPDTDAAQEGFQGATFTGVLDGGSHTVSHLTIEGGSYLGLVGQTESGSVVANLRLSDVNIAGIDYGGAVAGFNRGQIATSCVTGAISGDQRVGGLTGRNWGAITAGHNGAAVMGSEDVGGLAGGNYGIITDSYSTGPVAANRDIGGIVGANYGVIATSYSAGTLHGTIRVGGIAGYNGPEASVTASFWDTQTSEQGTSAGGAGKTTAEMQTANMFLEAGWDFVGETANGTEDIWKMAEGMGYPRLSWEDWRP